MKRNNRWSPESWREKETLYQPVYEDEAEYQRICMRIASLPPLVFPGEIDTLKKEIADAACGRAFILQGGDCVERFDYCREEIILDKVKIILQMSVILIHALRKPVLRIGRIAGQFFKPRSSEMEKVNGAQLFTYRGDGLHRYDTTPEARRFDPFRLLEGYLRAGLTLNYIRSLVDGGFADLHHPDKWRLDAIEKSGRWRDYREIVERIVEAINFMETFGGINPEKLARTDFYTSHEGLHLGYEETVTKYNSPADLYYNGGAHMVWIGDRTRDAEGGHVEYCRGIENPVGVKLGPSVDAEELLKLIEILNPSNSPGKIVLITRMGAERAGDTAASLAECVKREGREAAWMCDPMHGNTTTTRGNRKTRSFERILEEVRQTHAGLRDAGVPLAGVHFEMTGQDVTECTGGAEELRDEDLEKNYTTYCDPRLNYAQSLEMAFLLSRLMQRG
jgi:3-deoxy-7-phosphoheptulonate synthase